MFPILGAGTLLGADAANTPPDVEVQLSTATYNTFSRWFFAWQMGSAIEILIIAGLIFVLRPYLPFVVSKIWTHLPVVGVMNRVRNIAPFGGFILRNGMYRKEWRDNVMYYVKKYLGSYHFMGVQFDIVHIDRGFVQDPFMNKYICTLSDMGYKSIKNMDDAMEFNGIDPEGEDYIDSNEVAHNTTTDIVANLGYDSYETARKVLNPSVLTQTSIVYAPKQSNIPLDSLIGYGADISPGSIAAQVDDIFEYRNPPEEDDKLFKLLPYILLIMAMVIGVVMIIAVVR